LLVITASKDIATDLLASKAIVFAAKIESKI
jgi:hypothetical protein